MQKFLPVQFDGRHVLPVRPVQALVGGVPPRFGQGLAAEAEYAAGKFQMGVAVQFHALRHLVHGVADGVFQLLLAVERRFALPGEDAVFAVHPFPHGCLKGGIGFRGPDGLIVVISLLARPRRVLHGPGKPARGAPPPAVRVRADAREGVIRAGRSPRPSVIRHLPMIFGNRQALYLVRNAHHHV